MTIIELTPFQMASLLDAANKPLSDQTYMLIKANAELDPADKFEEWKQNNAETNQLVDMGFLKDVTVKYSRAVEEFARDTGRIVRVFLLTAAGHIFLGRSQKTILPN